MKKTTLAALTTLALAAGFMAGTVTPSKPVEPVTQEATR